MSSAVVSECGSYRYQLHREVPSLFANFGTALFLMLNPSTADAAQDDPTIRRCLGFARQWQCGDLVVVNLYALRSTDPAALKTHPDPVGPANDDWLRRMAASYREVVCAWGTHAPHDRVETVVTMLHDAGAKLFCLGHTKDGAPRHPLYVRADQPLIPFEWKGGAV